MATAPPAVRPFDAKAAAKAAKEFFVAVSEKAPVDVMLEEIEWSDDDHWLVTLGYAGQYLEQVLGTSLGRRYKVFKIDASTGEVVSMKIRPTD